MRRFTKAYLLIVFVGTLLANLVFIIMYGRQFMFDATVDCPTCIDQFSGESLFSPLVWLNLVLAGLFIFGYILARLLNHRVEVINPDRDIR